MSDSATKRISGRWYNQLGSCLELDADETGVLRGTYDSPVGGASGVHPLVGFVDPRPQDGRGALGFAVAWPPAPSVTVWAGHYDVADQVITATWLLSTGPFGTDEWRSTHTGHDVFRREPGHGGTGAGPASIPPT